MINASMNNNAKLYTDSKLVICVPYILGYPVESNALDSKKLPASAPSP